MSEPHDRHAPQDAAPVTAPGAPPPPPPPPYNTAQFTKIVAAVGDLHHPSAIGPYAIQSLIGEGGMGSVYKAEQRVPIRRTVALKVVKLGMDTREVIARFESERQALALMNHPNVAKVLDAGATDTGRPFFVMEYVPGEPITAYADRHKLTVRQRLELFTQACGAIQHAHQKAIIHRDLKPSNILVTTTDDKPQVKVIDFGVAKAISQRLTEKTLFTETGQLVGTPEYMAPEQAEGSALLDVDTRSDVYSLGVVLYELLSGSLPFDPKTLRSGGYNEIQRIIREVDPPRPSTRLSKLGKGASEVARLRQTQLDVLEEQLKSELEWIPLKAMHKDRLRRYASAAELAEDVENYLANRPLRAAPDSPAYRARKFFRRNRRPALAAAAVALALLAGVVTTTWQAVRATRQRDLAIAAQKAEAAAREYEQQTDKFLVEMFTSIDPEKARGRPVLVRDVLDQAAQRIDAQPPAHGVVEGYLRRIFGGTYRVLGLPEVARAQLERALAVDPYDDPSGPTRRAVVFNDLGLAFKDLGNAAEAEANLRRSLELRRAANGPDHPDTIATQSNLAIVLLQTNKHGEAESLLADAAERMSRAAGRVDLGVRVMVANNLAALRIGQGRFPEAEALYRETLKQIKAEHGDDHPHELALSSNLADLLRNQGRIAEAAELQGHVIELAAIIWGPEHLDTLTVANNYALSLAALGQNDEAEKMYRMVIERAGRAHGEDHPLALLAQSNHGLLLLTTGRVDEAERAFADVAPRMRRANGADHPDTIIAEGNLATARMKRGDLAGAEAIYRELLPRTKRAMGPNHPAPVALAMRYGEVLTKQEKWAAAEPLLADAYAGAKAQNIEPRIAAAAAVYGVCLTRLGKYDEADAPLRDAHQRLSSAGTAAVAEPLRAVLAALLEAAERKGRADEAAKWRAELEALKPATTEPSATKPAP